MHSILVSSPFSYSSRSPLYAEMEKRFKFTSSKSNLTLYLFHFILFETEPNYLSAIAATEFLSDTRLTSLSTSSLRFVNGLIDELLHLIIHNSTLTLNSNQSQLSNQQLIPTILNSNQVLTIQALKLGTLRVLNPSNTLAKSSILEAEIALRSLLKLSSISTGLHSDSSLQNPPSSPNNSNQSTIDPIQFSTQADKLFRSLRSFTQSISSFSTLHQSELGSKGISLNRHLTLLSPNPSAPSPKNDKIRFLLAFYNERILSTIIEYLLREIIKFVEIDNDQSNLMMINFKDGKRLEGKRIVELEELESAFEENEIIWSWLSRMRVKSIFDDNKNTRLSLGGSINGNGGNSSGGGKRIIVASGLVGHSTSPSIDSIGSANALIYDDTTGRNGNSNVERRNSNVS